jgi:drug/metabolite transporter (DMT)-like permease
MVMMAGFTLFAAIPLCLRWCLSLGFDTGQVSFWRFAASSALVFVLFAAGWGSLRSKNPPLLLLRGVLGGAAVFFWFLGLGHTTAAKGTLLNYMHSLWANLYAVAFFKARPSRTFWMQLGLALLGIFVVVNPDFHELNKGDLLAALSGLIGGGGVLTVKEARKHDSALAVFAAFSFVGLAVSLAMLLATPRGAGAGFVLPAAGLSGPVAGALLVLGLVAAFGQVFYTEGYAQTSLGLGTLLSLTVPVLAALGGWLLLGEAITARVALGGGLILAACAWLGWDETRAPGAAR